MISVIESSGVGMYAAMEVAAKRLGSVMPVGNSRWD